MYPLNSWDNTFETQFIIGYISYLSKNNEKLNKKKCFFLNTNVADIQQ